MTEPAIQPFDHDRFVRQFEATRFVRGLVLWLFLGGWVLAMFAELIGPWPLNLILLAGAIWIIAIVHSTRTARLVQQTAVLVVAGAPDEMIEPTLREAGDRFTLHRSVRVLYYHHLAIFRHRQGRYDQSAAIASALLGRVDGGMADTQRHHLLLMLTEALLQRGDLFGAYLSLTQLHTRELTLMERIQRLGLQLVYESRCGHDREALNDIDDKLNLIDLMAPPAAAVCHQHLGWSAQRTGHADLASWLHKRARLLVPDLSSTAPLALTASPFDRNSPTLNPDVDPLDED